MSVIVNVNDCCISHKNLNANDAKNANLRKIKLFICVNLRHLRSSENFI